MDTQSYQNKQYPASVKCKEDFLLTIKVLANTGNAFSFHREKTLREKEGKLSSLMCQM
jgi:hypothetical protein